MSSNHSKVTGITPTGSSQYSASYSPSSAADGSTSTYWRPMPDDTERSLVFALEAAIAVEQIRLYLDSSNAPSRCIVSGSNDGGAYTELATFTPLQQTGWQSLSFSNTAAYRYYKLSFPTLYASRLYLYEVELIYAVPWTISDGEKIALQFTERITSNAPGIKAFTVRGLQYDMQPGGTLIDADYPVESVSAYPGNDHAILLTMQPVKRFHNVEGALTVSYDAVIGNLAGAGGPVESFAVSITPSALVQKPNPHDPEHLEIAGISITASLIRIAYSDVQTGGDRIELASIAAAGVLTNINDL